MYGGESHFLQTDQGQGVTHTGNGSTVPVVGSVVGGRKWPGMRGQVRPHQTISGTREDVGLDSEDHGEKVQTLNMIRFGS